MKPLIGGRLLSVDESARLNLRLSNIRMAMVDSMERDEVIKAIAQHLYTRASQFSRSDDKFRRNRAGRKSTFHVSDLYR